VERLRKIEMATDMDEILKEEIREYKETLTCPSCKVTLDFQNPQIRFSKPTNTISQTHKYDLQNTQIRFAPAGEA
jgi:hypothetical protein